MPKNSSIKRFLRKIKESSSMKYDIQENIIPGKYLDDSPIIHGDTNLAKDIGWYKAVDSDEFPIAAYVKYKTGRSITNFLRASDGRAGQKCHYPSDVENIIKEFDFKRINTIEYYDVDEKVLYSRYVYEKISASGIILLLIGGYPTAYGKTKINKKAEINLSIVSNASDVEYETVRNYIINTYKSPPLPANNVHLVIASPGGYDTEPFSLPKQKIDIELNYGVGFDPIHKKILETLNKPKGKGLVLLHGDPGTGKTHYLKYLASRIKGKRVLFIPPYLADFITSPEMTPFLIENSNSVLFIEDAERVITDRSENGSTGVSNILNITDGILSDILNIQIVATFNMDRQKIDNALLRKGRLIAEHKFKPLSIDESKKLLKHLNIEFDVTKEMTLTEIYNCKEQLYVTEESNTKRRIGFGN
jgi:hypothetical protein